MLNLLIGEKFDGITRKGKYVFDVGSLQNTFELASLTVKRILNSTEEDRSPTKVERMGVKPPFTDLPSYSVNALVLSYTCYEFEASSLL